LGVYLYKKSNYSRSVPLCFTTWYVLKTPKEKMSQEKKSIKTGGKVNGEENVEQKKIERKKDRM
jgi:hypothetical protein